MMRVFGPQRGRRTFRQSLLRVLSLVLLMGAVVLIELALGLPEWVGIVVVLAFGAVVLP